MANDNNSALDPGHLGALLQEILAKRDYPSINIAIVFAGNLSAVVPGSLARVDIWIPITPCEVAPAINEFLGKLRAAWFSQLEQDFGISKTYAGMPDSQTLHLLRSRRHTTLK
ncbi:hypothetical protein [Cupriavidus nantongensis]|uniref:hypothetical protein n=1 Tax=Cupriavidus nantongensis TaxID=1796606 RepID=UPI00358E17AB